MRDGRALLALACVAGLAACDDGTGATAEELLGLWGAVEFVYTSDADPGVTADLLDQGGTFSLNLLASGSYQWELTVPGATASETGTFQVRAGELTLFPDGAADRVYEYTFDQIFLTLVQDDATYDFDGDGAGEPASHRMKLDRF